MKQSKLKFLPPEYKEEINYDDLMPEGWAEEEMKMRVDEHKKEQALGTAGILNDLSRDDSPKKLIYSDGDLYAFVYDRNDSGNDCPIGYGLWMKPADEYHRDDWCEVSDLTGVAVFTYQRLKEIAIAIGWIRNDNRTWLI